MSKKKTTHFSLDIAYKVFGLVALHYCYSRHADNRIFQKVYLQGFLSVAGPTMAKLEVFFSSDCES